MRLLVCYSHKTVDTLPDYDTANDMEGRHDRYLLDAIADHFRKYGDDPGRHSSKIIRIEDDEFALLNSVNLQDAIFNDSMESYIKGERDQYKDDAMHCYNAHNRPVVGFPGCPDYRSDSKAIGQTKGIPKDEWTYLCDFCVYNSYVEHEKTKNVQWK